MLKTKGPRGHVHRIAAGSDPDTTYTTLADNIRLTDGTLRAIAVAVPHDGSLSTEELRDAAMQMLAGEFPGSMWADAIPGNSIARPTPVQLARLKRQVIYFSLFVLLFPTLMVATSWALRERVFVPACASWGERRGLSLLGFTGHGGELTRSPPMFAASCNFGGAANQVWFRDVAGPAIAWVERFSAVIVVAIGVAGALSAVMVIAWIVEKLVVRANVVAIHGVSR